jgi:hypothetical protein
VAAGAVLALSTFQHHRTTQNKTQNTITNIAINFPFIVCLKIKFVRKDFH